MNIAERVRQTESATRLLVRCLGRFRLEDQHGDQLQLRTRKARALLAALALNGRPMSRDSLADLLWSDRGETQARSSLRQTIFELQHFGVGDSPILVAARDDLSARQDLLVTDIELIRSAASEGDWPRLLSLLADSEPGLLTDLDGLDGQFDDWLRHERAQEPARTLTAAVAAAERCLAEAGPRAALDLVSEILRLDPVNEEATRLGLRIDHELGDSRTLHYRFEQLRTRLSDELGAEPSGETMALFAELANGKGEPRSNSAAAPPTVLPAQPEGRRFPRLLAFAALFAAVAAIALLLLRDTIAPPARPAGPVLIAVLPFEQQNDQGFLASGLWEHTRAALTRNTSLQVLGRATTAAMVEQKVAPDEYLKRFGVSHLLEGTVRRDGQQVLVSVSLSRTSDGVAIWQKMFRGRMGEPFGLQDAIANGIEGNLRSHLAPQGGRRAEQIATTPEVYGLYSEARTLIASREREGIKRAEALLRQAVKTDPNYAPAWALLGAAIKFNGRMAIADSVRRAEALAAVKRALAFAPNLAQAHATLAILEGDSSPAAERPLRRAVALDPSYAEAWNWLGNSLNSQYRYAEALAAYDRATEIDPLLQPAVSNFAVTADRLGDRAAANRLLQRITKAGASPILTGSLRADQFLQRGDYSAAITALRKLGLDANGHPPRMLWINWVETLTAIGRPDLLHAVTECPDWYGPLLEGKILPPETFGGRAVLPEEFWTSMFFSNPASRAMVNRGQSARLVRIYRAGYRNADEFISTTSRHDMLIGLAPTLAVALKFVGFADEGDYILAAAARNAQPGLKSFVNGETRGQMAVIKAAQGERAQALALLDSAVGAGWLPDGRSNPLDLAEEPGFRDLRGDPRFEAARTRILNHIARERAELGPLTI
jgi:DNA-binding SARP family transcriptional activator/TolB-like protein/Tfp pilus assembly protein PilF